MGATPQTITFAQSLPNLPAKPASAITLTATASSSLTVAYTVVSGPATVSGSALTVTKAGVVVVRAAQAGDSTFAAAPNVDRTFTVVQLSIDELDALIRTAGPNELLALGFALGYCLAASDPVTTAKVQALRSSGHFGRTDISRTAIGTLLAAN